LFAQVVKHADQARFLELRRAISDPAALAEAQVILIRCGAISYSLYHLLERYQKAQVVLQQLPLSNRSELENLLEDLIQPVRNLFTTIGVPLP
jgi:geranylgeranyl pyrophosphate synthase